MNVVDLFLNEQVSGSHPWWGPGTDKQMIDRLKNAGKVDRINLHINSPGGDVFAGQAIRSYLKAYPAPVDVYIHGLAASIATIISTAGDKVYMSPGATYMIHLPSSGIFGDKNELAKEIEVLKEIEEGLIAVYKERTKLPDDQIRALLNAESWLSADRAIELGFADGYIPDNFQNLARGRFQNLAQPTPKPQNNPIKMQNLFKNLGLGENPSENEAIAALENARNASAAEIVQAIRKTRGLKDETQAEAFDALVSVKPKAALSLVKLEMTDGEKPVIQIVDASKLAKETDPGSSEPGKHHAQIKGQTFNEMSKTISGRDKLALIRKEDPALFRQLATNPNQAI